MTNQIVKPQFDMLRETRVFGTCSQHWEAARVTWDSATDTFLVETTQDDATGDDPFDTQQDWVVEKHTTVEHWMVLVLNAVYDDYADIVRMSEDSAGNGVTPTKLFILGVMFQKEQAIYDDFMLKVFQQTGHVDYENVKKSFLKYQANMESAEKEPVDGLDPVDS